jgi:transposase InsO family protein
MILNANIAAKLQNKSELAREMGVSRRSLYYQQKMPDKDLAIAAKIKEVMEKHPSYGYRRIAIALRINHKRALRVMQIFELKVKRKSKIYKKPNDIAQPKTIYKNLLATTQINAANVVWSGDFTYLKYQNNKHIFLATVIDAYTREILGYELSVKHDANLVINALFDAIKTRRNKHPKIFHCDQGSEYRSKEFTNILQSLKIKLSMSKKASPWQNGKQESFYGKFKLELGDSRNYESYGELFAAISKQIFYYNNERIHTALKMPPSLFYVKNLSLNKVKRFA